MRIQLFLILFFILSCAPSVQNSAGCGVGEIFNPVTRSCYSGVVVPETPIPVTNSISIEEDSKNNLITLNYKVLNNSLANQCIINSISKEINNGSQIPPYCSCVGGICTTYLTPIPDFSGNAGLTYTLTNNYGSSQPFVSNVNVAFINDPPVVSTPYNYSLDENHPITQSLQSFVTDSDGDVNYTFLKVTNPLHGTVTIDSLTGIFYYVPNTDYFGTDSFQWKVNDSMGEGSNVGTVLLNINEVLQPPKGSSQTVNVDEDNNITITLGYFDRNGFPPLSCILTDLVNVTEMALCNCTTTKCSVTVRPKNNYFTSYKGTPVAGAIVSFKYEITNQTGSTGKYLVNLNVNEVNDPPLAVSEGISGVESSTNYPKSINFTFLPPVDYDNNDNSTINDQVLTLALISSPTQGTLTNCLVKSSLGQDLNCTYTPIDGNTNGTNYAHSELSNQNVKLVAKFPGTFGSSISYYLRGGTRFGAEYLEITGNLITVNISSGLTKASKIVSLINGDLYGSKLVTAAVNGADLPQSSLGEPIFLSNTPDANFDDFQFVANDTMVNSVPAENSISIDSANDQPVICEYSTFREAYECGIMGCIAPNPPIGYITPTKSEIYYFDSKAAICWKSTGNTSNSWEIIQSHISDEMANEQEDLWVLNIRVDEGGGEYSEIFQQLKIIDLKSSNTLLLPTENINFYFNNLEVPLNSWFGSTTSSASLYDFAIKLIPQEGQHGESDLSFVLEDSSGATTTASFKIKIFDSAAKNNGWVNLKSVGPTTNHFGQMVHPILNCSYYLDKCSLPGETSPLNYPCVGQVDPTGTIMGSTKKIIYYNEKENTCWLNDSPNSGTTTGWVKFDIYCNISQAEIATECGPNGSCIFSNKSEIEELVPTGINNFYFDSSKKTCYRSTGTQRGNVQSYTATGSVTLDWKPFTNTGNGKIEGYDVFRRLTTTSKSPAGIKINRKPIAATTYKYEDNGVNSIFAPVPSTVYYYEVRPIINGLPTSTLEKYSVVRIISPPDNMVFVHRWVVNKRACEQLFSTQINTLDNFSCPYIAPGEIISPLGGPSSPGVYDIGVDLLVDRFEAGCPYSLAPVCTSGTRDNSCIGLNDPNTSGVTAPLNSIYYNRSTGQCFINRGGANPWESVNGVVGGDVITTHRVAQMAPISNISQDDAAKFCARPNKSISGILGLINPNVPLSTQLPNRLYQKAYSMWSPLLNNYEVLALESGLSLNSSSKCNTSNANGLENSFTETSTPDSSSYFTLPGSLSSNIRSFVTGSDQTLLCQSGFGVQDAVGNVSEWTLERITCPNFSQCNGILFGEANALITRDQDFYRTPSDDVDFRYWKLDGLRGPCNDSDADGICDGIISSWQISDQSYGAGRMAIPMALPIMVDFPTIFPNSPVDPYILNIGPTNGITAADVHEDTWTINNQNIYATSNSCGSMNTGGNYTDGNGAGVYNFGFTPCLNDAYNYLVTGDIAMKSYSNNKYSIEYIQPLTINASLTYEITGEDIKINLATDSNGDVSTNYVTLANCINNPTSCNCSSCTDKPLEANIFPGIDATNASKVFPMSKTQLNYLYDSVSNIAETIGFRCVTPVPYDEYIE